MTIAEKLNELASARGLTDAHIAAAMHDRGTPVSVVSVANWRAGRFQPAARHMRVLAAVLGVSLDDLCGQEVQS